MNNLLAQSLIISPDNTPIEGPPDLYTSLTTVGGILSKAIPFVFGFAGLALLLMLVNAGYSFLTSAGDAKKLEMGKQKLTYALVGFLIIFSAYWIVQIAGKILGFTEITSVFQ